MNSLESSQQGGRRQQGGLGGQQDDFGQQDFGRQQSGLGGQQGGLGGGAYQGNTSGIDTYGAGGDFGDTGRNAGQQRDVRDPTSQQSWDNSGSAGRGQSGTASGGFNDDYDNTSGDQSGRTGGKPSMGDKLKGEYHRRKR